MLAFFLASLLSSVAAPAEGAQDRVQVGATPAEVV